MESLLKQWNGENVVIHYDRPTGAWMIIAIHSTRFGPATGGTRMRTHPDLEAAVSDALRLAASMTYKLALTGFPCGGGKAVISIPKNFDHSHRPELLRRYGTLIKQLGGLYQTGPDVGTSAQDMDIVAETGAPHVFCRTPDKGGAGGSGEATALGVFSGIQAACEHIFEESELKKGRRVLVQGVGSVGARLIGFLREAGAEVWFSDVDQNVIEHYRDEEGLDFIPENEVYDTPCDVFAPCALGGILNSETIPRLKCRAVAGGANNQLAEPGDSERLQEKNILYAPDYVISMGGAMAILGMETLGWSKAEAEEKVRTIKETLLNIFKVSASEGITTEATARRIAESRLQGTG